MRRVASLLFFLLCSVETAKPCSCSITNPVCSAYWDTQLVFRGLATEITFVPDEPPRQVALNGKVATLSGPGTIEAHFYVIENFRGEAGSQVTIRTPSQGTACGLTFQRGTEYLVYSYQEANGEWWTGKCTRTHKIINAEKDDDLAWIRGLKTAPRGSTIFGTVTQLSPNYEINGYQTEPLAGITVRAQGPETRSAKTDSEGKFSMTGLAVGKYEVSPEYPDGVGPPTHETVSVLGKGCAEVQFSAQTDGAVGGNILN